MKSLLILFIGIVSFTITSFTQTKDTIVVKDSTQLKALEVKLSKAQNDYSNLTNALQQNAQVLRNIKASLYDQEKLMNDINNQLLGVSLNINDIQDAIIKEKDKLNTEPTTKK
jgi:hypothetical protein